MPDPFERNGGSKQISMPADHPEAASSREAMMAEAHDLLDHATAFTLIAAGPGGQLVKCTIGNGVNALTMMTLFADAAAYCEEQARVCALEYVRDALASLDPEEDER